MKEGVYFARLAGEQRIKIGHSVDPVHRLASFCNYHKKDGVLLGHIPTRSWLTELKIHKKFHPWALGYEFFYPSPELLAFIEKHSVAPITWRYESRGPQHSRRKLPLVVMTPERIRRVGELLNSGMTGPEVAKKLKVSTASVYAFWKHAGKGRFVHKRKTTPKTEKD